MNQVSPSRPLRPWRTAIFAGMASYLDAAILISTGIALVLYRPVLGFTTVEFGLLSAFLTFSFAAGTLVGGRLGDRFGRRRVYTVTLIGLLVASVVLATATSVVTLFPAVILAGFAVGADLPVSLALIGEEAPEGQKGKFVAFSAILWLVGISASNGLSAIVGGMGDLGGRIMFGHVAVVSLIVLIFRTSSPESPEWQAARKTSASAVADGSRADLASLRRLIRPPYIIALISTALFYSAWVVASNMLGQFSTFLFTQLGGVNVQTTGLIKLVNIPIGIICGLLFMRAVDSRRRYNWFVIGSIVQIVAFGTPLVFGAQLWTLLVMSYGFSFGAAFAGEAIYKVWSQEFYPTLLRTTAQGSTMAVARVVAGTVAIFIPTLVVSQPNSLFMIVTLCLAFSSIIGFFWIRTLPKATSDAPAYNSDAAPDHALT